MSSIEMCEEFLNPTNIKVIGVGGAGCNTINRMIETGFQGIEFISLNTDVQSLSVNHAHQKIQIGAQITKGLGTGASPEVGEKAALESREAIQEVLLGAHMVFLTAGMGGGTGTGAAPVIAQIAKEMGILTVAFVSKPFAFEGSKRMKQAVEGIKKFENHVDSIIVIANQKLMDNIGDPSLSLMSAFDQVDQVLLQGVQGITDIINKIGIVNVDFADVKVIISDAGTAIMGFGEASGKDRAQAAVEAALNNPLLDIDIKGARGVLVNISGTKNLSLVEYNQIVEFVTQRSHEDANIIAGAYIDEQQDDQIQVTVIANSFQEVISPVGAVSEEEKQSPIIEESVVKPEAATAFTDEVSKEYKYQDSYIPDTTNSNFFKSDINRMLSQDLLTLSKLDIPAYQRKKI